MPVFGHPHLVDVDTERLELGLFSEAALEFREPREAGETDHVIPQLERVFGRGKPGDHRTEECDAAGWLKMDDRCTDVAAGQCEGLVGLGSDLGVPRLVVEGRYMMSRQAQGIEDRPEELLGPRKSRSSTRYVPVCESKIRVPNASYSGPIRSRPCSRRTLAAARNRRNPAECPASYSGGKCAA